jgi:hypothetical protein
VPAAGPSSGPSQALAPEDAKLERLERLTTLHNSGGLTDGEFASAKAGVLGTEDRPE